jgi:hypothetical protein
MSKDLSELDWSNLSDSDHAYFDQRPWLKEQYERVSGNPFPEKGVEEPQMRPEPNVQQMSASNAGTDTSGDPSGPPAEGTHTADEDEVEESYADWDIADLRAEIDARNEEYGETSERHMSKGGSKADLASRLEDDDALREQDDESGEDESGEDEPNEGDSSGDNG